MRGARLPAIVSALGVGNDKGQGQFHRDDEPAGLEVNGDLAVELILQATFDDNGSKAFVLGRLYRRGRRFLSTPGVAPRLNGQCSI